MLHYSPLLSAPMLIPALSGAPSLPEARQALTDAVTCSGGTVR